jgi:hypothetical protein
VCLVSGCRDNFDPRSPLQEQIVVFSILSTDREMQSVRVQRNYMPPTYDPLSFTSDNALRDAIVTIVAPNKTYRLRDTLLWQSDTSRYKFPIHSFYVKPFTPQRGRTYAVDILSASMGKVSVVVEVPEQAKISIPPESQRVLDLPDKYIGDSRIDVAVQLAKTTKGCVIRLFAWYDVLIGNEWREEAVEIPVLSKDSAPYTLENPIYPKMTRVPANAQIGVTYRNGYFKGIVNKVNFQYKSTYLVFKWIAIVVLQADENLYKYYVTSHAIADPWSVRLDEPMASTINGGIGMVGAYTLDSLVYLLPYDYWGNRDKPMLQISK